MNAIETLSRSEMRNIKGGEYPQWCEGITDQIGIWHDECTKLATSAGAWASARCHRDLAKTKALAENICVLSEL